MQQRVPKKSRTILCRDLAPQKSGARRCLTRANPLGAALERVICTKTNAIRASVRVIDRNAVDAFQKAFGPRADSITGDIPNYTDIQPLVQLSEVKI